MPGKFSRQPTSPNKPPVCHKAPLIPLPLDQPFWKRDATLVLRWWGDASTGNLYRSWMLTLRPGPWVRAQSGEDNSFDLRPYVVIDHFIDPSTWGYGVRVTTAADVLLDSDESNLFYQTISPWDTGLQSVLPNLATARCELQAMA